MVGMLRRAVPLAPDAALRLIVEAQLALTEFHATGRESGPLAELDLLARRAAQVRHNEAAALHIRAARINILFHRPVPNVTMAEIEQRATTFEAVIDRADALWGARVLHSLPLQLIQLGHAAQAFG